MAVTVKVNGVDLSTKHRRAGFSIKNSGMQGIAVADVDFVDEAGTAAINLEHVLQILDGATEIFEGPIRHRVRKAVRDPGIAKKLYSVKAQDFTTLLADDTIDVTLLRVGSRTDKAEVEYIVTTFGFKGITVGATVQNTGTITRDIDYTGMNLYEALEEASKWLGTAFYVDSNLVLHWFVAEVNAAPFNLSDTPNGSTTFGYRELELEDESVEYCNAVFVVGDGISGWRPNPPPAGATRRAQTLRDSNVTTQAQLDLAGDAFLAAAIVGFPIRLKCYQPGLKAGMTIQLTNALWGLAAVTYRILEVTTSYEGDTTQLAYDLILNSKPPDIQSLFTNQQRQGVSSGIAAQQSEQLILDMQGAGANQVPNSSFEDGSGWTLGSNHTIAYQPVAPQQARSGTGVLRVAPVGGIVASSTHLVYVRVDRTKEYWASYYSFMRSFTAGTLRLRVSEYDSAFVKLIETPIDIVAVEADWTRHSLHFGANTQQGKVQFQPTTVYVRLVVESLAGSTFTADVDDLQFERSTILTAYAPSPYELVDGSVGTTKIADDAVTTPKVIANAIVAGKIATGAVTTAKLDAEAVVAGKLQVGLLPSRNMLKNGGFRNGLVGWTAAGGSAPGFVAAMWPASDVNWTLRDGDVDGWLPAGPFGSTAYMYGTTTAGTFFPQMKADLVPVTAGEYYSFSALIGLHRLSQAYIHIVWLDAAGATITDFYSNQIGSPAAGTGGTARTGWNWMFLEGVQAPAGAASCLYTILGVTPNTSGADWYCFMDQCWMGVGKAARPYDPQESSRVWTANTDINEAGVTIRNGALTLIDQWGTSVMTGGGFGEAWRRFITNGVYNGDFFAPPLTPANNILSPANVLPYWGGVVSVSGTAITMKSVADANTGSGRRIDIDMAAGAAGDWAYIEQMVPINSARNQSWAYQIVISVGISGLTTDKGKFYLYGQYFKKDKSTTTGVGQVVTSTLQAPSGSFGEMVCTPDGVVPGDAYYLLIRFGWQRDTALTSAVKTQSVYEAKLIQGATRWILGQDDVLGFGSTKPPYVQLWDGNYLKGNLNSVAAGGVSGQFWPKGPIRRHVAPAVYAASANLALTNAMQDIPGVTTGAFTPDTPETAVVEIAIDFECTAFGAGMSPAWADLQLNGVSQAALAVFGHTAAGQRATVYQQYVLNLNAGTAYTIKARAQKAALAGAVQTNITHSTMRVSREGR